MANFLSILLDFGVGENNPFLAYLVNEAQARVILIVDGNRRVCGAAQFGQILIRSVGGLGHALRITHAHARAQSGGG